MKYLICLSLFLISSAFAEMIPSHCLKRMSNGKVKSYKCKAFDSSRDINITGVCLYDNGWKYGN